MQLTRYVVGETAPTWFNTEQVAYFGPNPQPQADGPRTALTMSAIFQAGEPSHGRVVYVMEPPDEVARRIESAERRILGQ